MDVFEQTTISNPVLSRRLLTLGLCSGALSGCAPTAPVAQFRVQPSSQLSLLETNSNGRLGVCILDTKNGRTIGWRENERFSHCSSFKMSLAAMLLARAQTGEVNLEEVLRWTQEDILPTSPITREKIATGLSVRDLARATLLTSDNTAANVLMRRFGGPEAMTSFWRSLGDNVSRLDRYETELNEPPPGTQLDTTTPMAIAHTTAKLVTGSVLNNENRTTLRAWMNEVQTGSKRIRAGFPADWASGDKTGTGFSPRKQTYVDIAYGGPVGRAPLIVAAFFEPIILTENMSPDALATLAEVGRIAALGLQK